jgi:hypothetical protein
MQQRLEKISFSLELNHLASEVFIMDRHAKKFKGGFK